MKTSARGNTNLVFVSLVAVVLFLKCDFIVFRDTAGDR